MTIIHRSDAADFEAPCRHTFFLKGEAGSASMGSGAYCLSSPIRKYEGSALVDTPARFRKLSFPEGILKHRSTFMVEVGNASTGGDAQPVWEAPDSRTQRIGDTPLKPGMSPCTIAAQHPSPRPSLL